jgi:hypothetical protein
MTCIERYAFEPSMPEAERQAHMKYCFDHCWVLPRRFPNRTFISADEFAAITAEDPAFHSISLNSAMVHRTAFERFGRFNSALLTLDDWEFFARVAANTGVINVSEELTNFRIHSGSYGSTTHVKRPFKMDILSPLIIRHEVVNSPYYANVRSAARRLRINLKHRLLDSARAARSEVDLYARRNDNPDSHAHEDWAETVRRYPKLFEVTPDYYATKLWDRGLRIFRRAAALLTSISPTISAIIIPER